MEVVKKDGVFYITNVPLSNVNKWEKAIKKGNLLYSVAQKPAKEVAPSSPGNNIIPLSPESVKAEQPLETESPAVSQAETSEITLVFPAEQTQSPTTQQIQQAPEIRQSAKEEGK